MSNKLLALREELTKAVNTMAEHADIGGELFEKAQKAVEELKAKISRQETSEREIAALAQPANDQPGGGLIVPGRQGLQVPRGARVSKLKNFRGEGAEIRAFRFGHFALAAIFGSQKSMAWCKDNGVTLVRAQSEGVNSAGGFLVPEEFTWDIIDLRDEYGMFRRLCQVVPMGRDTMNTPRRTGGLTAYPVGEGQAGTLSQLAWDNVKLTANKWMTLTLLSSEIDEDAVVNIGDIIVGEMAYAFAVAEDTAGFVGDGTSTYHGILGFTKKFETGVGSAQLAGAVDAASGHDTFAEIDASDLAVLMGKLPQYAYRRGNPAFYCSQLAWALVFQRLIMASGGISKDDATGKVVFRYLGFPVEISPSLPAVTTDLSDRAMIMFGDIGLSASFGDRRGMAVARSTEYKFAEDQIAIKATERFDINIHDVGDTANAGPTVALIGE
jgi:HK97 family phage major capsid protein